MFPPKARLKALLPVLIVLLLSHACYLPGEEVPEGGSTDIATQTRPANTIVQPPSSACPVDLSGQWTGTAGERTYSMNLTQTACTITGASATEGITFSTVNGYIENGYFYFTESGPDASACYWTGSLQVGTDPAQALTLTGEVTNCSQPSIILEKTVSP